MLLMSRVAEESALKNNVRFDLIDAVYKIGRELESLAKEIGECVSENSEGAQDALSKVATNIVRRINRIFDTTNCNDDNDLYKDNLRATIKRAGPCVLGIDEIDRRDLFNGTKTPTDPGQIMAVNLILDTLNEFKKICDKYGI
ncbi:MAG: hypothetical protein UT33_C0005G0080 [Candidatus Peregrinibacteria bacterium GW2011_GWC2_39_14]|nr:MAG: hypothetical protein US92_C0001G0080 [Candidatus Peregrinibacteria bacterium GW2011_GWA2_38_36]KKR07136.1 MAG: hypothetical protein UT33_C0005G0080 [Candidatus Peregrinibacteria bacterium GW2011_GWC2_39_14]